MGKGHKKGTTGKGEEREKGELKEREVNGKGRKSKGRKRKGWEKNTRTEVCEKELKRGCEKEKVMLMVPM